MTFDIEAAMKATLWEEAKGKLRALVAVQGSYPAHTAGRMDRWQEAETRVEAFINQFELDGLHE